MFPSIISSHFFISSLFEEYLKFLICYSFTYVYSLYNSQAHVVESGQKTWTFPSLGHSEPLQAAKQSQLCYLGEKGKEMCNKKNEVTNEHPESDFYKKCRT